MMTLDACGISCPEPLIMLKKAFQTETELILLVDNEVAFSNCERFAKSKGFSVVTEKEHDIYRMLINTKNE
ncbi:MAG: sulfurtransferase TusA family protein [Synergistaceae bacterium]|nr:sulfurtransferase TusA family protein [Synergistaceae bacterium]